MTTIEKLVNAKAIQVNWNAYNMYYEDVMKESDKYYPFNRVCYLLQITDAEGRELPIFEYFLHKDAVPEWYYCSLSNGKIFAMFKRSEDTCRQCRTLFYQFKAGEAAKQAETEKAISLLEVVVGDKERDEASLPF